MVQSIRDQIDELRVVLTPLEQDSVATVIAAVIYAVLDASMRDLDDTLVRSPPLGSVHVSWKRVSGASEGRRGYWGPLASVADRIAVGA